MSRYILSHSTEVAEEQRLAFVDYCLSLPENHRDIHSIRLTGDHDLLGSYSPNYFLSLSPDAQIAVLKAGQTHADVIDKVFPMLEGEVLMERHDKHIKNIRKQALYIDLYSN